MKKAKSMRHAIVFGIAPSTSVNVVAFQQTPVVAGCNKSVQSTDDRCWHLLLDLETQLWIDDQSVQIADEGLQGPFGVRFPGEVVCDIDLLALHQE
jgi:hypothetical protein